MGHLVVWTDGGASTAAGDRAGNAKCGVRFVSVSAKDPSSSKRDLSALEGPQNEMSQRMAISHGNVDKHRFYDVCKLAG